MKRTFLIIGLILQLTVSGIAQQRDQQKQAAPQSDQDVVRISTNLVQVDPIITDSKGKQVTGLRADEVQILEDGKPQKITNFSYITLDSTGTTAPEIGRASCRERV